MASAVHLTASCEQPSPPPNPKIMSTPLPDLSPPPPLSSPTSICLDHQLHLSRPCQTLHKTSSPPPPNPRLWNTAGGLRLFFSFTPPPSGPGLLNQGTQRRQRVELKRSYLVHSCSFFPLFKPPILFFFSFCRFWWTQIISLFATGAHNPGFPILPPAPLKIFTTMRWKYLICPTSQIHRQIHTCHQLNQQTDHLAWEISFSGLASINITCILGVDLCIYIYINIYIKLCSFSGFWCWFCIYNVS